MVLSELGENTFLNMMKDIQRQLINDGDEEGKCIKSKEEWCALMASVCQENGVEYSEARAEAFFRVHLDMVKEQAPVVFKKWFNGLHVDELTINLVYSVDVLAGLTTMVSKEYNEQQFADIREKLVNSADENKKLLKAMHDHGESRPHHLTRLGTQLQSYTAKFSECYDDIFTDSISRWMQHRLDWPSYEELQAKVQSLKIRTHAEYDAHKKCYDDWPTTPRKIYPNKWIDWGTFVGVYTRTAPFEKTCVGCGNSFLVTNSKLRKNAGKYCSRSCKKPKSVQIKCHQCDELFGAEPNEVKAGRKFCSKRCFHIHLLKD
jgi:hypothetical protein